MRAIRIYGSSAQAKVSLDEVAVPKPAAGEILMRVHATAVTPGELEWYPTWHTRNVQAAVVPISGLTAWQALFDHGKLTAGQKVLIHGGAGGVGSFAIQLAAWTGGFVATTVSGANI
jgi:NADPH:quinone reductase-like Zn-dependent oxidoreductase